MKVEIGSSFTVKLDNGNMLDVSYYDRKYSTRVSMSAWTPKRDIAVKFNEKTYFKFEKLFSDKLAEKILTYYINKQSREVSGIEIIE
jgi:hypothetical protein